VSESSDADGSSGLSLEFGPGFTETEREHAVGALDEAGFRTENFDVHHRGVGADQ
jgi:hypothetical protein